VRKKPLDYIINIPKFNAHHINLFFTFQNSIHSHPKVLSFFFSLNSPLLSPPSLALVGCVGHKITNYLDLWQGKDLLSRLLVKLS